MFHIFWCFLVCNHQTPKRILPFFILSFFQEKLPNNYYLDFMEWTSDSIVSLIIIRFLYILLNKKNGLLILYFRCISPFWSLSFFFAFAGFLQWRWCDFINFKYIFLKDWSKILKLPFFVVVGWFQMSSVQINLSFSFLFQSIQVRNWFHFQLAKISSYWQ